MRIIFHILVLSFLNAHFSYADSAKDSREGLAQYIEREGQILQTVQDKDGIAAAHRLFFEKNDRYLNGIRDLFKNQLQALSEAEATEMLAHIQNSPFSEAQQMIQNDFSLSSRDKLYSIVFESISNYTLTDISQIQTKADQMGYKKAFQAYARLVRSRSPLLSEFSLEASGPVLNLFFFVFGRIDEIENPGDWGEHSYESGDSRTDSLATMFGLGLGMSFFSPSVIFSLGFGNEDGPFYGVHVLGGFVLALNLGVYTNGKRLLFLVGVGPGMGAGAALSELTLPKQKE